jgi:hypothetical protein
MPGGGRLRGSDPSRVNRNLIVVARPGGVHSAVEDVEAVGEDPLHRAGVLGLLDQVHHIGRVDHLALSDIQGRRHWYHLGHQQPLEQLVACGVVGVRVQLVVHRPIALCHAEGLH